MVDKINQERMAGEYGFALAFLNSDPELRHLFQKAVRQTWDANRFVAGLRNTKWFKHHSANVRNAIMQQTSDPATYKANVDQMYSTVRDAYGKMFGGAGMDNKSLRAWAETGFRMGWSEAQLIDHMTKGLNYRKLLKQGELGGSAAEIEGQLNNLITNYGLSYGDKWKAGQLEKLMEGDDTIQGVQNRIREQAKREYGAFAEAIDGGATIADIAEPYKQMMSDLLELNPGDVDVKDKMIQRALRQTTPKGKPAALSMTDFADMVRQDKRWQYTDNAREQVSSVTKNLLDSFGLTA